MEQLFHFDMVQAASFLLTLIRISLVVFLLPFFGGTEAPNQVKAAICFMLTVAVWPNLSFDGSLLPGDIYHIALMIIGELLLGMLLGMSVHFIFAGIQTGGQMLSFQMGFSMVTVADPSSGGQVSMNSHLLYMVAMLSFLALDGHLFMIRALGASFAVIPPGGIVFTPLLVSDVIALSAQMFVLAVKIASPVLAALLMVELTLGLMARTAPQMNLLMLGMPLKIAVGFFFMGLLFAIMAQMMNDTVYGLDAMFRKLLINAAPVR